MDDKNNKAARKVRELTSHLEEEDLWDLEDSTEDEGNTTEPEAKSNPLIDKNSDDEETAETGDLFEEPAEELAEEVAEVEADTEEEVLEKIKDEKPKYKTIRNDSEEQLTAEEESDPEDTVLPTAPASDSNESLIKKISLSMTEKIALSAVAISLIGLAIWGYVFLHDRNSIGIGMAETSLEFPIKGEHTIISDLKTYWQAPVDASGVKLGAEVIPFVSITLADDSTGTGAFRIYFYDADDNSVGDTITLEFTDGKFSNGEKTTAVSGTDGFHEEGDFNAYVLDRSLAWEVQVLEAGNANADSADFKEMLKTTIEPIRK